MFVTVKMQQAGHFNTKINKTSIPICCLPFITLFSNLKIVTQEKIHPKEICVKHLFYILRSTFRDGKGQNSYLHTNMNHFFCVPTRPVRGPRIPVGLQRGSEPRRFQPAPRCVRSRHVSSALPPSRKSRRRSWPSQGRHASVSPLQDTRGEVRFLQFLQLYNQHVIIIYVFLPLQTSTHPLLYPLCAHLYLKHIKNKYVSSDFPC